MAIGSYLGQVFTVNDQRIITPANLQGSTGSDWATHNVVGGKARAEYLGPKLKSYTMDILLRAQDGVNPRRTLEFFQWAAEKGMADFFIIGNRPISPYRFRLISVSDTWNSVLNGGALIECTISLNIAEYL